MLLVFCNNYREVEKLNVFQVEGSDPYIEFYIPREYTEVEFCSVNEVENKVNEIKAKLSEGESLVDLKVSTIGEKCCVTYSVKMEVMYNIPIKGTHREVKTYIDGMIKAGEVIDIDKIQYALNKSRENVLYGFAENIVKRI